MPDGTFSLPFPEIAIEPSICFDLTFDVTDYIDYEVDPYDYSDNISDTNESILSYLTLDTDRSLISIKSEDLTQKIMLGTHEL